MKRAYLTNAQERQIFDFFETKALPHGFNERAVFALFRCLRDYCDHVAVWIGVDGDEAEQQRAKCRLTLLKRLDRLAERYGREGMFVV